MPFDPATSMMIVSFAALVAGALLMLAWSQHWTTSALGWWAVAFFLASLAVALIVMRGAVTNLLSIVFANAILAIAYGLMWNGARVFDGRHPRLYLGAAGAALWLSACLVPAFYETPHARAVLMAAVGIVYTLLTAGELWRGRSERLASRLPIVALLVVHAVSLPLRIPLIGPQGIVASHQTVLVFIVALESILLLMCGAFLFGSMAKERLAHWYRQESLIDPLTGTANRRAFMKHGSRLVDRARVARQPIALLLFDLDRFKSINDRFGHATGDAVLVTFCNLVTVEVRPTDYFARMGGEEFACLLPDTSHGDAIAVAERVREAFERTALDFEEQAVPVSVSVGVATADAVNTDLASLLVLADRALYVAKQGGRNRVEAAQSIRAATPVRVLTA
jgi:diguanylate cyclase (GGDEF)-like protein